MRSVNENGLKLGIACTLATVALIMLVRVIAGSDAPTPSAKSASHGEGGKNNKFAAQKESNLSLLRNDQLKISEGAEYAGKGRNIFRLEIPVSWTPPQSKPLPPAPEKQLPTMAT